MGDAVSAERDRIARLVRSFLNPELDAGYNMACKDIIHAIELSSAIEERNERHRERRAKENREILIVLIADLSALLTDENDGLSIDGLADLRRRVANALPPDQCPDWLRACRDPSLTQGRTP